MARNDETKPTDEQAAKLPATTHQEDARNYFFQHYPPAEGYNDAQHFLTTQEVMTTLRSLGADDMLTENVFDWLIKNGYRKDTVEMQLRWLIAEAK